MGSPSRPLGVVLHIISTQFFYSLTQTDIESRKSLNKSQKEAVITAMNNKISLVQGPPGTGKTTTIASMVQTAVKKLDGIGKVLLAAPSNAASDNLILSLQDTDLKVCIFTESTSSLWKEIIPKCI